MEWPPQRVEIFQGAGVEVLKRQINAFLEALTSSNTVFKILQSSDEGYVTISIFYK
jgi:hypothetical protein